MATQLGGSPIATAVISMDDGQGGIKIFISYSHKDAKLLGALLEQMSLLKRQGIVDAWHDRRIAAGSEWAGEIDLELEAAEIVLLLVSSSFLASDYSYDVEMKRALERHDAGKARVIPIILRPCDWRSAPFGKLKALPRDGKPVTTWKPRDEAFVDIVEGIRNAATIGPRRSRKPASISNLRQRRNPFFAGRDQILRRLHDSFRDPQTSTRIQILAGLGGHGKSQTALEYVYRYGKEYQAVFWIRADSEAELRGDFLAIAKLLRLVTTEVTNTDAAIALVLEWLGSHDTWLTVFDNADDPGMLRSFLPAGAFGNMLVTSRASEFDVLGVIEPIDMPSMAADEAVDQIFVRTKFDRNNQQEQESAIELAEQLGFLPLALEQAGACIAALKITIQAYLESFRVRKLSLLEEFPPVAGDYKYSVATTWNMNFQEVERLSRPSADLLRVCSFLTPDNIPLELLSRGASRLGPDLQQALQNARVDRLVLPRLLRPLRRFSLIRLERGSSAVVVHRLVQDVVQSAMDLSTRALWIERTVDALLQAFPMENLSPAETVIHLSRGLELVATLPAGRERELRDVTLRSILGPSLISTSGYASSKVGEVYLAAESICRELGRPPVTFQVMWGLWGYHYVRADLQIALQLASELVQQASSEPDPDQGHLLEADRAMASTLFTVGKITESQAYFRQALNTYDPSVHGDHGQTYVANPAIVCRSYLTICDLLVDGELAGLQQGRRLAALARAQRQPFSRVYSYFWAACFQQLRREVIKSRRIADRGVEISRQHHFQQWGAMNRIVSGWCLAQQGEPSKGVGIIEAALDEHERTGARTIRPYFLLLLAESQALGESLAVARQTVDQALACCDKYGEQTWLPEILRTKGEMTLKGDPDSIQQTESLLRAAIDTARRQGALCFELRAWISLGKLLEKCGREAEFRNIIHDVLEPACHRLLACDYQSFLTLSDRREPQ